MIMNYPAHGYRTAWNEYVPGRDELEELNEEERIERFREFCRTPKAIMTWLCKDASMPAVMQFYKELGEYELEEILDNIYYEHEKDIEDYFDIYHWEG